MKSPADEFGQYNGWRPHCIASAGLCARAACQGQRAALSALSALSSSRPGLVSDNDNGSRPLAMGCHAFVICDAAMLRRCRRPRFGSGRVLGPAPKETGSTKTAVSEINSSSIDRATEVGAGRENLLRKEPASRLVYRPYSVVSIWAGRSRW